MMRVFLKNRKINQFQKLNKKFFSTAPVCYYPYQVLEQLRSGLTHESNESQWAEVEVNIMENIHFFDADQYVDTVCLLAHANKGTEALWDLLSAKIFDYEIDLPQTYALDEALGKTTKYNHFIADPISRNNLVWDIKWEQESKVFKKLL